MTTPARGMAVVLGALVLGVTALAGCGDDADGAEEREPESTTTESTTTTQPPASDLAAVRPVIEELVADLDDVLAEVLVDPAQLQDPESPIHEQLAAVFTEAQLQERLTRFETNASQGIEVTPLGGEPLRVTTLWGEITPDGENSLEVLICTTYHYRQTGPAGGEEKNGLSHPGIVYAEREDGVWKVSRTDEDHSQICDPTEPAAS
jgi:hypothetical protein